MRRHSQYDVVQQRVTNMWYVQMCDGKRHGPFDSYEDANQMASDDVARIYRVHSVSHLLAYDRAMRERRGKLSPITLPTPDHPALRRLLDE